MKCPHCGKRFEDKDQKMRRLRSLKGICQRCKNPAVFGKECCQSCLDKAAKYAAGRKREKNGRGEVN